MVSVGSCATPAGTAAHLVDRVLPAAKVRQWVLSLPMSVRLLCAFKPQVLTAVVSELTRALA